MVAMFALLGAVQAAQGECLSPSAASGDSATTVYRCHERQITTARQDPIATPSKTTVVERGPAGVPWFAPAPAAKVTQPAEPLPQAEMAAPTEALPQTQAAKPEERAEEKPDKKPAAKTKPARKKLVKLKSAKAKSTKALVAKTKPGKKAAEANAASEKPDDNNTVVWTRKDMPLGNRIVNWLGL